MVLTALQPMVVYIHMHILFGHANRIKIIQDICVDYYQDMRNAEVKTQIRQKQ